MTSKLHIAANGVLLLNKPIGLSSNVAMQRAKRIVGATKAGHTGSLDPLATGILPICFGEATKFSQYLLDADKSYLVTAQLGIKTTTGDAEGEILEQKSVPTLSLSLLEALLSRFRGEIMQTPPMYSALKYQGKPLYALARQGKKVDIAPRTITIHQLILRTFTTNTLTLFVHCSKGTYIRSLVEAIGDALGSGAHVIALHRVSVGHLPNQMVTLEALRNYWHLNDIVSLNQVLLPMSCLVKQLPVLSLDANHAKLLQQGQFIEGNFTDFCNLIALYHGEDFIGVGEILAEGWRLKPKRLVQNHKLV